MPNDSFLGVIFFENKAQEEMVSLMAGPGVGVLLKLCVQTSLVVSIVTCGLVQ